MDPVSLGIAAAGVADATSIGATDLGITMGAGAAASAGASTAASVGIGSTIAGGITAAVGSVLGGLGMRSMDKYQAGVARVNAQIAKQNADYALKVGESKALESGMRTRAQIGTTLAQQGRSGLDVNRGSAVAVRGSESEIGRYDQAVIRSNAAKTAYGYEVQAMEDTAQGQVYQMAGEQAMTAGEIGGVSSLLGTAGSVSSKWLQASQMGVPGYQLGNG